MQRRRDEKDTGRVETTDTTSTMTMDDSTLGKVFLIGAGPGDPKLLTLRAAEAIGAADVIVFDHLVNPEILAHARRGAELVYAGKRSGLRAMTQPEINRLMIEHAEQGRIVARLKGGDPFIFGRGGEEAQALARAGVPFDVIPGVSSGLGAAAYAGIPLTHRDHSSSVVFVTGHDSPDKNRPQVDWSAVAGSADTLVIFMCSETIKNIARSLIEAGRPVSTPIAVVRWATYKEQEVFTATLEDVAGAGDELVIEPPAIAIVGEVVSLRDEIKWFGKGELEYSIAESSTVFQV
jgi:uroporphyrinogen III methyltransferase/synthase